MVMFLACVVGFVTIWCAYLVYALDKLNHRLSQVIIETSTLIAQLLVADMELADRIKKISSTDSSSDSSKSNSERP